MPRWPVFATLLIGYPLLVHYTNESARGTNLAALVAIAPAALLALVLSWRSRQRLAWLGVLGLAAAALYAGWPALVQHYGLVYWLQYVVMQLILCATFARTLFGGRKPLCTQFAEAVHAPLTPQQFVYTRKVTLAWSWFFAVMAAVSTLLFFAAPVSAWSVFNNILTLPLVALMFIAEFWARKRALPDMQPVPLLAAVRAFWKTSARSHF